MTAALMWAAAVCTSLSVCLLLCVADRTHIADCWQSGAAITAAVYKLMGQA